MNRRDASGPRDQPARQPPSHAETGALPAQAGTGAGQRGAVPPESNTPPAGGDAGGRGRLVRTISGKQERKLAARGRQHPVWFGLGMFGLVGWSVALPALLGVAVGNWLDRRWPSRFSWTLMLLVAGVALGCLNAWRWIARESGADGEVEPAAGEDRLERRGSDRE